MVVRWLRHMETYRQIARTMGGSAATVSREIWDLIPKLYVELRNDIRLPTAEQVVDLPTFLNRLHIARAEPRAPMEHRVLSW